MTILAIANLKGGTGKTTTATNLAAGMANRGRRVLLVDLDSQGSASIGLGVSKDALIPGAADVLLAGRPVAACLSSTACGVDVLTGSLALADVDLQLATMNDRGERLRMALEPARTTYDIIMLDCATGIGLVTVNALHAADAAIVPVLPHYLSLEGLVAFETALERIREGYGQAAALFGVLLTQVDRRPHAARAVITLIRQHYGRRVFRTEIPVNTRLAEAPSHGAPIGVYAPTSSGARAYAALVEELLTRLRRLKGTTS